MKHDIELFPLNEKEYGQWNVESKFQYCEENIQCGMTREEAQQKTDEDFKRLLPEGLNSKDQFIFSIKAQDQWVGTIWFGARGAHNNRKAFIYDIIIKDSERGKGYGKQAMQLIEVEAKKVGLERIALHVFGHNTVARKLYEGLGYEITNLNLEKIL